MHQFPDADVTADWSALLAGFVIYGTGSILVTSVVGGPDVLAGVGSQNSTLAIGAFLMIATTAVDIDKTVLFFRSWNATASSPRWPTWQR